jgi:hypothetical protein
MLSWSTSGKPLVERTGVLKRMEKLVKIELSMFSEEGILAISSFESPIPKFFSAAGHRVIQMNES